MDYLTLGQILGECRGAGWAVPAFDVINLETVRAVLQGAQEEQAPVILMIYPNHNPPEQWPGLLAMVRSEAQAARVPVCLHLDHGRSIDQIEAALAHGFSSVMIDGSTLPLAENIALTRHVVGLARASGASVEAELGHVGSGADVLTEEQAAARLTRPEEAAHFVAATGVDALAVAIGTVHGLYRAEPRLDFERLAELNRLVPVPLVLHGGSGTPDADVRRAVAGGICKVNIWTEVGLAFIATLKQELAPPAADCRLPAALSAAEGSARQVIRNKIRLLGATGRSRPGAVAPGVQRAGSQSGPLLLKVDCLRLRVPDLEAGLAFYRDRLGQQLIWRTEDAVGLRLPQTGAELVLATRGEPEVDLKVTCADLAAERFAAAGGTLIGSSFETQIGRAAVVEDPWGNRLVLLDTSKGLLLTDSEGHVIGNVRQ